jgi:cellulose synthase/poly-beta-1,6-N-acetylglucosamine synthase-like glycosyltransferase
MLPLNEKTKGIAEPFVSVIIPVYDGAEFLSEAVASIWQQNYHPLEIIIVDDGSTDETAELVTSSGKDIRYAYQRNSGPAAARNNKNTNGFQLTKVLKKSLDRRRARNNGVVHSLPKFPNFDEAKTLSPMVSK